MEGYFKVSTYAKLCGIKLDTAWHRVLRGQVDSIIGKDGVRYVYYSKEDLKGYIPLRKYCKEHGINPSKLLWRIQSNYLKEPNIKKFGKSKKSPWYIREDYVISELPHSSVYSMYKNKPEGYLTIKEWCLKTKMNYNTTRVCIHGGKIDSIRINGHVYIPKDFVYISPRNKNKGFNGSDMKRKE